MRVGTRTCPDLTTPYLPDHPHACGDKTVALNGTANIGRIIPMRVGTSFIRSKTARFVQDHPHACGDKRRNITDWNACGGSSPCVWGQVEEG